jgi:hypothetical protein
MFPRMRTRPRGPSTDWLNSEVEPSDLSNFERMHF